MSQHTYAVRVLRLRTYWYDYVLDAASPEEARAKVQAMIDWEGGAYFDGLQDVDWDFEEDAGYRIQDVTEER